MQFITTVTQKGQVTLPKKLRQLFKIEEYSKVLVEPSGGTIKIKPIEDILDLVGKLRPSSKKPLLKAREAMEKNYRRF